MDPRLLLVPFAGMGHSEEVAAGIADLGLPATAMAFALAATRRLLHAAIPGVLVAVARDAGVLMAVTAEAAVLVIVAAAAAGILAAAAVAAMVAEVAAKRLFETSTVEVAALDLALPPSHAGMAAIGAVAKLPVPRVAVAAIAAIGAKFLAQRMAVHFALNLLQVLVPMLATVF